MTTADTALLQPTLTPAPSLAATCARRFSHFTRTQFDPNSQKSWDVADKLWRAAIMARDAERGAQS